MIGAKCFANQITLFPDAGEKICYIVENACSDSYAEVKKECALCIIYLCRTIPSERSLDSLVKPLLQNLCHQHSRVRCKTLVALGSILSTDGRSIKLEKVISDQVLPALKSLTSDRSAKVRKILTETVTNLILSLPESQDFESVLLPLIFAGISDGCHDVQEVALRCMEELGCIEKRRTNSKEQDPLGSEKTVTAHMIVSGKSSTEICERYPLDELPSPYTKIPSIGARHLVERVFSDTLSYILRELKEWTSSRRFCAAGMLHTLLMFGGRVAGDQVHSLLSSLIVACRDEESDIASRCWECACLLGVFIEPDLLFPILLPQARGLFFSEPVSASEINNEKMIPSGESSAEQRAGSLIVLSAVLRGMSAAQLKSECDALVELLCDNSLFESESTLVQNQLLNVCSVMINTLADGSTFSDCNEEDIFSSLLTEHPFLRCSLLRVLLQLGSNSQGKYKSTNDQQSFHTRVHAIIDDLAEASGFDSTSELYESHFAELLSEILCVGASKIMYRDSSSAFSIDMDSLVLHADSFNVIRTNASDITSGHGKTQPTFAVWTKCSPQRCFFDSFIRSAFMAVGKHNGHYLQHISPVFLDTMQPERDPDMRLSMLSLLETLLSSDILIESWRHRNYIVLQLLSRALMPNLIWRAGRVATTIRKVAMACLITIVKGNILSSGQLVSFVSHPDFVGVITSCLDDGEAYTRYLTTSVLAHIFKTLKRKFDNDIALKLYPDLIKRLDDSNDEVRLGICQALQHFWLAPIGDAFHATAIEYMLDCLLVHMDDTNKQIQESVLSVLIALTEIQRSMVMKKASVAREQHRSPYFCDQLLSEAEKSF